MHHASLIVGSFEEVISSLPQEIHTEGPDVQHLRTDRLTIDEARTLMHDASLLPLALPFRTFVIAFRTATIEAQNALLKTLEEPVATSRFFIIVPRPDVLMSTVRSRLMVLHEGKLQNTELPAAATTFLTQSYRERLADIALKAKAKDQSWMEAILVGLEIHASEKKDPVLMDALIKVRGYFVYPGASKKMLLEHLALLI